jgi:hypothetical protein
MPTLVASPRMPWLLFGASIISARLFSTLAWALPWYESGMLIMLVVTVGFAAFVLVKVSGNVFSVLALCLGLVVGNWSLVIKALTMAIWSANGFAP